MSTASLRCVVAAGGPGSRAGLPYPKTLFPIRGQPILAHILTRLASYDPWPAVIVSPDGKSPIESAIGGLGLDAEYIVQPVPKGMGDAVLCLERSQRDPTDHILLLWGDIPFIQASTIATLVARHYSDSNDLTFATRVVERAYTVVRRDAAGKVLALEERRETGLPLEYGECDIGLFVFRRAPVMECLKMDSPGKYGALTGEHGFLYVVKEIVEHGFKVAALPIATELDLVSLNELNDVETWLVEAQT